MFLFIEEPIVIIRNFFIIQLDNTTEKNFVNSMTSKREVKKVGGMKHEGIADLKEGSSFKKFNQIEGDQISAELFYSQVSSYGLQSVEQRVKNMSLHPSLIEIAQKEHLQQSQEQENKPKQQSTNTLKQRGQSKQQPKLRSQAEKTSKQFKKPQNMVLRSSSENFNIEQEKQKKDSLTFKYKKKREFKMIKYKKNHGNIKQLQILQTQNTSKNFNQGSNKNQQSGFKKYREQLIRYICYLSAHKKEFERKDKYLLHKFCLYSKQTSFRSLQIFHMNMLAAHKGKNFSEIIELLKQKHGVTQEDMEGENLKLKKYEETIKGTSNSEMMDEFYSQNDPFEGVPTENIKLQKLYFDESLEQSLKLESSEIQILDLKNQNLEHQIGVDQKDQNEPQYFMAKVAIKFEVIPRAQFQARKIKSVPFIDPNTRETIAVRQNLINKFQYYKMFDKILRKKDNESKEENKKFISKQKISITPKKLEIEQKEKNESQQIEGQFQLNLLTVDKDSKQCKFKYWFYEQNIKFLTFLSLYKEGLESQDKRRTQTLKFLSQYIGSRNKQSCYLKFYQFLQQYETIDNMISQLQTIFNIRPNELQQSINRQIQKCMKAKRVVYTVERNREYELSVSKQQIMQEIKKNIEKTSFLIVRNDF